MLTYNQTALIFRTLYAMFMIMRAKAQPTWGFLDKVEAELLSEAKYQSGGVVE